MAAPDHDRTKGYNLYSVESAIEPEVVPGVTITSYSDLGASVENSDVYTLGSITADGEKYSLSVKAFDEAKLLFNYEKKQLKDTYNLYMDTQGSVLGIELIEEADQYIFVVGYDVGSNVLAQAVDKALIITTEGEMKTVNASDDFFGGSHFGNTDETAVNAWYSYSVKPDGTYVLIEKAAKQGATNLATDINSENVTLGYGIDTSDPADGSMDATGYAYGNDATTYITVKADNTVDTADGSIVKINGVYTGIKNVDIEAQDLTGGTFGNFLTGTNEPHAQDAAVHNHAFFLYNAFGYVTHAVVVGEDDANNENLVYLTSGIKSKEIDAKGNYYFVYSAIVNGEATTVKSEVSKDDATPASDLIPDTLYEATFDVKTGYITNMKKLVDDNNWQTSDHKDDGFAFTVDTNLAVGTGDVYVTLRDANLWVTTAANNNNYVLTTADTVFFVKNNAKPAAGYDLVDSAQAAVAATKADDVNYIKSVNVVCNKTTGFAEVVIIDLAYKAPAGGGGASSADLTVTFAAGNATVTYTGTMPTTADAGLAAIVEELEDADHIIRSITTFGGVTYTINSTSIVGGMTVNHSTYWNGTYTLAP